MAIDAVYEQAVLDIQDLMVSEPGRPRPERKAPKSLAAAAAQGRRHSTWCPEGFEVTREIREDKLRFFDEVRKLRHPFAGAEVDLPADVSAAVITVAALQHDTPRWREQQMARLQEIARRLEPMSAAMLRQQREHVAWAAPNVHVALWCALVDALEWPDDSFPLRYCITGFDVIGVARDTGLYRRKDAGRLQKEKEEATSPAELLRSNARSPQRRTPRLFPTAHSPCAVCLFVGLFCCGDTPACALLPRGRQERPNTKPLFACTRTRWLSRSRRSRRE